MSSNSPLSFEELLFHKPKEKIPVIEPWLNLGNLCLLYAERGVGKSWLGLWLAHIIASNGSIGSWQAKNRPVVYLDGEMGTDSIVARYNHIRSSSGFVEVPGTLKFWTVDQCGGQFYNLSSIEGKTKIWPIIKDSDVIIIDNLMTVTQRADMYDTPIKIWERIQSWLINLRARNKTVILVHHTNKEGLQSGTKDKENIMDIVIQLLPCNTEPEHKGAKFRLAFEKTRSLKSLDDTVWLLQDSGKWDVHSIRESQRRYIIHLQAKDWKDGDICKALSISKSYMKEILSDEIKIETPLGPPPSSYKEIKKQKDLFDEDMF